MAVGVESIRPPSVLGDYRPLEVRPFEVRFRSDLVAVDLHGLNATGRLVGPPEEDLQKTEISVSAECPLLSAPPRDNMGTAVGLDDL